MRPYCVYIANVFYSTEYKNYAYVFTVISITKEHKNIKKRQPVHNATPVQKVHSQNNFSCVELCFVLIELMITGQEVMKRASLQVLHHII